MAHDSPENLQMQQLYTFRDVYESGGYAAAANQSRLSVPTIWQHIQAVERAYRVKLFEKRGRRVTPTPAADQLHEALDEILVHYESTFEMLHSDDEQSNRVTLVAGNRMMMEDLASPLAELQKLSSSQLMIRQGNNKRAEELLLAGEADLALSLAPTPEKMSGRIHYEAAYRVDFLAVAPKRHAFAKSPSSSLRELVKHPLVVTAPGTHGRDALEQALHREQLEANVLVETDNSGFTIACVQAGMGLGILAGRPDGPLCRRLVSRSLRRQLGSREIVFMWRKGRRLTPAMTGVIEMIRKHHR